MAKRNFLIHARFEAVVVTMKGNVFLFHLMSGYTELLTFIETSECILNNFTKSQTCDCIGNEHHILQCVYIGLK